jgi:helicase MOV-10
MLKDPYWEKTFVVYGDNNSYKGCPLLERQSFACEEPIPKTNSTSEVENSSIQECAIAIFLQ